MGKWRVEGGEATACRGGPRRHVLLLLLLLGGGHRHDEQPRDERRSQEPRAKSSSPAPPLPSSRRAQQVGSLELGRRQGVGSTGAAVRGRWHVLDQARCSHTTHQVARPATRQGAGQGPAWGGGAHVGIRGMNERNKINKMTACRVDSATCHVLLRTARRCRPGTASPAAPPLTRTAWAWANRTATGVPRPRRRRPWIY